MLIRLKLFTKVRAYWVLSMIRLELLRYIGLNLTEAKRSVMDQYLSEVLKLQDWSTMKVIKYALRHLQYVVSGEEMLINIDELRYLPRSDYRLNDIIRLIDKGNLEVKGTLVISEASEYAQAHMNQVLLRMVM